jgi:hypothetical protein
MSSLLLVVVRVRECSRDADGRYEATRSVKSATVDVEGREKERVDGSDSPGKDERRILTGAIVTDS